MSSRCAIGVDVGGTKCAAGLVQLPSGKVLARRIQPTDAHRGGQAVLSTVIDQVRSLQHEASDSEASVAAVGVGVAELVSTEGRVLSEATIRWKSIDVQNEIRAATALPAYLDADVRVAARAEGYLGAGKGCESFIYVTIGTGISACLVLNGTPYAGARGMTGTFASSRVSIPNDDRQVVSGPPLEQFSAGPALAARFSDHMRRPCSTSEVLALAAAGDEVARSIVESAGRAVGAAVAQLVNMLDPVAVVLGGGLGVVGGSYQQSLETGMRDHVWSHRHRDVPVLVARLSVDAGFIGAALTADEMESRRNHRAIALEDADPNS